MKTFVLSSTFGITGRVVWLKTFAKNLDGPNVTFARLIVLYSHPVSPYQDLWDTALPYQYYIDRWFLSRKSCPHIHEKSHPWILSTPWFQNESGMLKFSRPILGKTTRYKIHIPIHFAETTWYQWGMHNLLLQKVQGSENRPGNKQLTQSLLWAYYV